MKSASTNNTERIKLCIFQTELINRDRDGAFRFAAIRERNGLTTNLIPPGFVHEHEMASVRTSERQIVGENHSKANTCWKPMVRLTEWHDRKEAFSSATRLALAIRSCPRK